MRLHNFLAILACAFLSLATGCFFGDSYRVGGVSVSLQTSNHQTNGSLSARDTQVQDALKLIDAVLVSNGFARDSNPIAPGDQARGLVAFYGVCSINLETNTLKATFIEAHRRHFSAPVKMSVVVKTEATGVGNRKRQRSGAPG
jgi:hypothetical protein